jgi:hypothetical protein
LALAVGCAQKEPPPEKDWNPRGLGVVKDPAWGTPPEPGQKLERLPGYTFVEQQFRFVDEKEFPQLARSREFIRKLERLAPREKAPGYWIDQIPATKPPFVDMERMEASTLYFDKQAVLDHWPAFRKRYPLTADYLIQLDYWPSLVLLGMPGNDFKGFIKRWYAAFQDRYVPKSCPDYPAPQAVGDCLLYVDFLAAHGGRQEKWNACRLLAEPTLFISLCFRRYTKSAKFGWAFSKELLLPLLAPTNEQYWMGYYPYMLDMGRRALEPTGLGGEHMADPEYIRAEKWVQHFSPLSQNEKMEYATLWSNAYGRLKDHIGVFLCLHAGHIDGEIDKPTLTYMRNCLVRHFGEAQGDELFWEYLGTIPVGKNGRVDKFRAEFAKTRKQK